jgi:hypothetical protein
MNKYTKIGLSALCGSLASVSAANAGSMDVTGSALITYTGLSHQVTGNPIGMATGMTFTGNGELDGGQTFSIAIANTNKNVYSSANITLNTNSAGSFKLSSAEGGAGIGGYDDNNHQAAWEEVWDTGITTNANFQKGVSSSTNISWTSPKYAGTTFQLAYTPDNDGSSNVKKAVSGDASNHFASGWDFVLDTGTEDGSINMFIGGSRTEIAKIRENRDLSGDHEEAVVGLSFKLGPVALGGQISGERLRERAVNSAEYYGNSSWGIAFNVNDSLSVSYSEARHLMTKTHKQNNVNYDEEGRGSGPLYNVNEYTPKSWMRGDSIQVAYTFGGIGLKYARTNYDNTLFTFDSKIPRESQIVALSLAF